MPMHVTGEDAPRTGPGEFHCNAIKRSSYLSCHIDGTGGVDEGGVIEMISLLFSTDEEHEEMQSINSIVDRL